MDLAPDFDEFIGSLIANAVEFTRDAQPLASLNHPNIAAINVVMNWFDQLNRLAPAK